MKRHVLLLASAVALMTAFAPAQACRIPDIRPWPIPPVPPQPLPPPPEPMLTRLHKADIHIEEAVARVEVAATFYNPNGFRVEGTYFFPIEADAVVKDFAMTVNGKEQKAELLEADKARKTYEDIVRRMKDPGLLEYVGTRMLKASVFPIEPRSEVQVRLNYTQVVRQDAGLYRLHYPLSSARPNAGKVDQVSVRVTLKSEAPVKLFYSPTHTIDALRKDEHLASGGFEQSVGVPDRDFDLYWSVDREDVGLAVATYRPKGEDGFCLISLAPRTRADENARQPKDVIFAFDKSGSMAGDKIRQAKSALKYCLSRLDPDDRFGVIAFSTDVDQLSDGLTPATPQAVAAVLAKVEAMDARGGTAIHAALTKTCELAGQSSRLAMIVFLTDGRPTVGPTGVDEILSVTAKDKALKARVFAFGVGNDLNTDLLDRLATENRGAQQYVGDTEDIEIKVSSFYEKIAMPVLADVVVEADGVELRDLYPRQVPDVFAGGQVLLFGRYRGDGRHRVTARGRVRDAERSYTCEADFGGSERNDFLPAIWAHRKVAYLMEEIRLRGHNKELEDEVVALGKRYGIMTPYTSFLIVEDEPAPGRPTPPGLQPFAPLASRREFEQSKTGADGVAMSRSVLRAKGADALPAASASADPREPGARGGFGIGFSDAPEEARAKAEVMAHRVKRIADKVFYLQDDGFYYDSLFDEKDRGRIVIVKSMTDEYFELLRRHEGIGKYLAGGTRLVICLGGEIYRIEE